MSLFLLSFAGIPLTAGFIGKLSVFTAAMESGMGALVVLAMVATAVTAFFYLRIVVVMYFSDPVSTPVAGRGVGRRGIVVRLGAAIGAAGGTGTGRWHRRAVRGGARHPDGDRDRGGGHRDARLGPVPGSGAGLADRSAPPAVVSPRVVSDSCCVPHRTDGAAVGLT